LVVFCLAEANRPVLAVEGGTGAYLLGSRGFMGGFVPPPGLYVSNDFIYFTGNVDALAIGGIAVTDVDLDASIYKLNTTYVPKAKILGGAPAFNVNVPVVSGNIAFSGALVSPPIAGTLEDEEAGLGDITLTPMIGWHHGNWHSSLAVSFYLPTGVYDTARINVRNRSIDVLSIGKNKLAVDPTLSLTYFNPKTGAEVSASAGVTFNEENGATDYQTADEFHLETTIAGHTRNNFIIGVTSYYYQQLDNDSGTGARNFQRIVGAESLQARVFGVGPIAQYSTKIDGVGVSLQGRYLHEFGALRRLESDIYWATLSFGF
jgi:hypothetical protein